MIEAWPSSEAVRRMSPTSARVSRKGALTFTCMSSCHASGE